MTDLKRVNELVDNSGFTKDHIAKALGMSYRVLYNKLQGVTPFSAKEIARFKSYFRLSSTETIKIFIDYVPENGDK